jgi:hypothetical protein
MVMKSYEDIPKLKTKKLLEQINIWVEPQTKEMYRHLSDIGINSAECLRRVIRIELERLCELANPELTDKVSEHR